MPLGDGTGFYLRPNASLAVARFNSSGGPEDGLGAVGLRIDDASHTIVTGEFGVDVGMHRQLSSSTSLSAFAGVSRQMRSTDDFVADTSFIGAPTSAGSFNNFAELGDPGALMSLGVSVADDNTGLFMDMGYERRFGTDTHFEQFNIDLGLRF